MMIHSESDNKPNKLIWIKSNKISDKQKKLIKDSKREAALRKITLQVYHRGQVISAQSITQQSKVQQPCKKTTSNSTKSACKTHTADNVNYRVITKNAYKVCTSWMMNDDSFYISFLSAISTNTALLLITSTQIT